MRKKIIIISISAVLTSILVGYMIKPSKEWGAVEVAEESFKMLKEAESYSLTRNIQSQMISPQDETLEDGFSELYKIEKGSNDVISLEYYDKQLLDGEEKELGKALFYIK